MNGALLLVLLVGLVAAWWTLRSGRSHSSGRTPAARAATSRKVVSPYHCVEIRARGEGCAAVRRLAGKRFLSAEAPLIPLMGCSVGACACTYKHYNDRRREDRRDPYGSRNRPPPAWVEVCGANRVLISVANCLASA